ncbi:MAG: glutamine-hydrolyzing carbamoyl-phosphate synthase small subunit, partial [Anaplasmataceae bacterium]|nr:glutamine-hydrolyzing carbamoyl-phosphate synthase small subunit [Anaplasmataceae bacterium]
FILNFMLIDCDKVILLSDGSKYYGFGKGYNHIMSGELCFNTSLTGYQHTISDPSYANQIIVFANTHIGNIGANNFDYEREFIGLKGIVVCCDPITGHHHECNEDFEKFLIRNKIPLVYGIDTRGLIRKLVKNGVQKAVIANIDDNQTKIEKYLEETPSMNGMEIARSISLKELPNKYTNFSKEKSNKKRIALIDFGTKYSIIDNLENIGCEVVILGAQSDFANTINENYFDGVVLSNGPGDPLATAEYTTPQILSLIAMNIPIFAICLGHQLLAISLGMKTIKMHTGHRGTNHPVYSIKRDLVEITSQNHGFVVDSAVVPDNVEITHYSLFDNTIEGIKLKNKPVSSVQYHPEAGAGTNDSIYLFNDFLYEISNR